MSSEVAKYNRLELTILICARNAGIRGPEWTSIYLGVGANKIEDFLELKLEHFNQCNFDPELSMRIKNFLEILWSQPNLRKLPPPTPTQNPKATAAKSALRKTAECGRVPKKCVTIFVEGKVETSKKAPPQDSSHI